MQASELSVAAGIGGDQSLHKRRSPHSAIAARAISLCVVFAAFPTVYIPFLGQNNWMLYVDDDFFYYLKTATNLAHGHGSTFSEVPTNGYHPLWFILIAAVSSLSSNRSELPIVIFLSVSIFAATLITYVMSRHLLRTLNTNSLVISALAALVALSAFRLYLGGMEIVLTVPLILAVVLAYQSDRLWDGRFWPSAGFGLILSAMFLSRLDTGLLVLLITVGTIAHPELRSRIHSRQVGGVIVGLGPAILYLFSNQLYFHTWLPISGMSKQLKSNHLPSWPAWHYLFHNDFRLLVLIAELAAAIIIPKIYRRLTAPQQVIYPVLIIFPFVYVLVLSCISDWILWDWYFYCLRPALCVSFAVFLMWRPTGRILKNAVITMLIAVSVPALLVWKHTPVPINENIYAAASEIRDFAMTHPGIYAMGDRSGTVGYLLPEPMIQTEGLVMDRDFLKLIENRTPLREVLNRYHVRYYVASSEDPPSSGCYHAIEPRQAGPNSPHMIGDFCQPPLATFVHGDTTNLIFDLDAMGPGVAPSP